MHSTTIISSSACALTSETAKGLNGGPSSQYHHQAYPRAQRDPPRPIMVCTVGLPSKRTSQTKRLTPGSLLFFRNPNTGTKSACITVATVHTKHAPMAIRKTAKWSLVLGSFPFSGVAPLPGPTDRSLTITVTGSSMQNQDAAPLKWDDVHHTGNTNDQPHWQPTSHGTRSTGTITTRCQRPCSGRPSRTSSGVGVYSSKIEVVRAASGNP